MSTENENAPQQSITNQNPAPVAPEPQAPPSSSPPSPEPVSAREPKVITIPSNAMAQIKREEREKGKKAARLELEAKAKKLGFATLEEMEKAAMVAKRNRHNQSQPRKAAQPAQPAPRPVVAETASTPTSDRTVRRLERERERAREEARRFNKSRATEERKRKDAERRVASLEAEMELRSAAIRAGVQDVDYALHLLRSKVRTMKPADLAAFDEAKYFAEDLQKSHPYLYGVQEVPAHTASTPGPAGARPGVAGQQQKTVEPASNGAVDARKLTADQFQDLLRKNGIKNPSAGL